MPTYDYACGQCGHGFEFFQSILAERLVTCPSCGGDGLKRLIGTGGGIIFKGSGFYQTDYKNQTKGEAKPAGDGKAGDSAASKPAGGADPKPTASTPPVTTSKATNSPST